MPIQEPTFELALGDYQATVEAAVEKWDAEHLVPRLWAKDAALWSDDAATQAKIINRLGWLDAPLAYWSRLEDLKDVRDVPYKDVVLLGMGGSSLAPELFQRVFGNASGKPRLHVLDNTTADAVTALHEQLDIANTLFIIASKSGTTTETKAFTEYFYKATGGNGEQFIAITDPGSKIIAEAAKRDYRALYYNAQDIGGRYSVYSFFGLLPAALIGVDLDTLLARAEAEIALTSPSTPVMKNGALALGVTMATLAREGRNKLTFLCSPSLEAFGDWAEQLVAESTGKQGEGVLPVVGERPTAAEHYGNDRLFVYLRLRDEAVHDELVRSLHEAGHPVVVQLLNDKYDVGTQFYRWEFATAVAGVCLGINPFDEPNVTESKTNTNRLLDAAQGGDGLPTPANEVTSDYADAVREVLATVKAEQYVAIIAYLPMSADNEAALRDLQARTRDITGAATTLGFGPRYLHSTGQYHKGGTAQGVFIQIVSDDQSKQEIPGAAYDFSTLASAQSLGELEALRSRDYETLRLKITGDVAATIREIVAAL